MAPRIERGHWFDSLPKIVCGACRALEQYFVEKVCVNTSKYRELFTLISMLIKMINMLLIMIHKSTVKINEINKRTKNK